jgi:cell wall-associated NlpC family hydrolase
MPFFLFLAPPIALLGLAYWAWSRGSNSEKEDMGESKSTVGSSLPSDVMASLGWPYFFGKGSPSTKWADGKNGVDCSGYAQMVLVKLGLLSSNAGDRGAASLADDSNPVEIGDQKAGDLAYYPGHVMVVAGPPGADGHSPVIGASGGGKTTLGNDPDARIKYFDTAKYRSDFVTYMRLKSGV